MTGVVIRTMAETGFVGEYLVEFGLPPSLANAIGSAAVFLVVLVLLYVVGKLAVVPVVDRLLRWRGLDEHARKPLRFIVYGAVVFVAVGMAFALAGYGSVLQALSTIAAAATLAIGFAMQGVIKNYDRNETLRLKFTFRIGFRDDIDQATDIILKRPGRQRASSRTRNRR